LLQCSAGTILKTKDAKVCLQRVIVREGIASCCHVAGRINRILFEMVGVLFSHKVFYKSGNAEMEKKGCGESGIDSEFQFCIFSKIYP
jgi:hypothetical protein